MNVVRADVECDEICEFCGHRSTQVRNYVTYYDKCRARNSSNSSSDKKKTAAMKKRILCRKAASELDEMSKAREDKFNSKDHGESDTTAPSPKRRRTIGDALTTDSTTTILPNLPFDLTRNTASTTGLHVSSLTVIILLTPPQEPTSCSFDGFPQSNGHNNYFPITNSELRTPMITNNKLVSQFGEQFPRATVFSSRTMDNLPYRQEYSFDRSRGLPLFGRGSLSRRTQKRSFQFQGLRKIRRLHPTLPPLSCMQPYCRCALVGARAVRVGIRCATRGTHLDPTKSSGICRGQE